MTVICSKCKNECCNCKGCNPVFINNTWMCPWCAQWERQGQQGIVQQQSVLQNITIGGDNNTQYISGYMRKR